MDQTRLYVSVTKARPPCGTVADFLWGPGHSYDSDGNSLTPDDPNWTELTVDSREEEDARVDVDPAVENPLVLVVRSERPSLAARVAYFLARVCDGGVAGSVTGPFSSADTLRHLVGEFDLDAAMRRALG